MDDIICVKWLVFQSAADGLRRGDGSSGYRHPAFEAENEMHDRHERRFSLFVSGGVSTQLFGFGEESLDAVSPFTGRLFVLVERTRVQTAPLMGMIETCPLPGTRTDSRRSRSLISRRPRRCLWRARGLPPERPSPAGSRWPDRVPSRLQPRRPRRRRPLILVLVPPREGPMASVLATRVFFCGHRRSAGGPDDAAVGKAAAESFAPEAIVLAAKSRLYRPASAYRLSRLSTTDHWPGKIPPRGSRFRRHRGPARAGVGRTGRLAVRAGLEDLLVELGRRACWRRRKTRSRTARRCRARSICPTHRGVRPARRKWWPCGLWDWTRASSRCFPRSSLLPFDA